MEKYAENAVFDRSKALVFPLVYAGVLMLASVWLAAIFSVPLWIRGNPFEKNAAVWIHFFFSSLCHQIPERSFQLSGHPLAVCARCTGIYAGFVMGIVLFPFLKRIGEMNVLPLRILVVAALPAVVEWSLDHLGLIESSNEIRCMVGLLPGMAAAFWVLPAVFQLLSSRIQIEE